VTHFSQSTQTLTEFRHTQFLLFSVSHFTSIALLFKTQVRCLAVNYIHRLRPSKAAFWLKWILIRDWSEIFFISTNSVNCHGRDPHMKHMWDLTKRQLIPIELDIRIRVSKLMTILLYTFYFHLGIWQTLLFKDLHLINRAVCVFNWNWLKYMVQ